MDYATVNSILNLGGGGAPVSNTNPLYQYTGVSGDTGTVSGTDKSSFESVFQSAMDMINETNDLTHVAEQEAINFSLGYTDNWHDLMTAQKKASLSLQYTIATRNAVLDAYKEIMNMQF